ncbi:hypothetical protein [Microseira wollei]|nr:hypothetical protein [Microseira wollei]
MSIFLVRIQVGAVAVIDKNLGGSNVTKITFKVLLTQVASYIQDRW